MYGIKLAIDERDEAIRQLRLLADGYRMAFQMMNTAYERERILRTASERALAELRGLANV